MKTIYYRILEKKAVRYTVEFLGIHSGEIVRLKVDSDLLRKTTKGYSLESFNLAADLKHILKREVKEINSISIK